LEGKNFWLQPRSSALATLLVRVRTRATLQPARNAITLARQHGAEFIQCDKGMRIDVQSTMKGIAGDSEVSVAHRAFSGSPIVVITISLFLRTHPFDLESQHPRSSFPALGTARQPASRRSPHENLAKRLKIVRVLVVLNLNLIADLQIASKTTQHHTLIADIQRMREMNLLAAANTEPHRCNRFGSLRLSLTFSKSRHVQI
jgi:hypothetical protein